ncbi:MAG: hypothetical protein U0167_08210 [bacterium]
MNRWPRSIVSTTSALAFVLLLTTLARAGAAPPAGSAAQNEADADKAEVSAYKLTSATMAKVEKAYDAFAALLAEHPSLRDQLGAMDPMQGLDETIPTISHSVAVVDAVPPLQKAIADAGLQTREFVVFGYSLAGTMFASALANGQPLPKDAPPALAGNVRWYEANKPAVQRFQAKIDRIFPEDESGAEDESGNVEADSTNAEDDVPADSTDADSTASE